MIGSGVGSGAVTDVSEPSGLFVVGGPSPTNRGSTKIGIPGGGNSDTIEEDAGRYRIMMCSINIPLLPCRKSKQQTMLCYDKVEGND